MIEPSGGLALVFTDIEGSTELARELKGSYGLTLRVHRRMLERCFEECRGTPIGSEGDSLYYVFPTAALAVAAAISAQQKIDHHDWPDGRRLRVRMGIHLGPLTVSGGEYVGLTVHEVARICAVAHGGQILCSDAVARALAESGDPTMLADLGTYLLRGFPEGRRLFQVCADGLEADFPLPRDSIRDGGVKVAMWFRGDGGVTRCGEAGAAALSFRGLGGAVLDDTIDVEVVRAESRAIDAFRLVVRQHGTIVEEYDGLTAGGVTDAATIVNANSRLIRIAPNQQTG